MSTAWIKTRLSDLCRPKQWPTIGAGQLLTTGFPVYGANGRIGFFNRYTHANPTLLITCRGATCGNVLVSEPMSYVTGNAMALDDLAVERVDLRFLVHYLRHRGFRDVISGSAQPQITGERLSVVEVPIPPLQEQKRIAAILDAAEALREKRCQSISATQDLIHAIFFKVFGGPDEWSLTSIGSCLESGAIIEIQDGNHGERHPKVSDFASSGVPFITANCLDGNELSTAAAYCLPDGWLRRLRIGFARPGDVLLTHKGSVGLTAVVPQDAPPIVLSPQVTYYRLNREQLVPEYLWSYFQTPLFQSRILKDSEQSTRAYIGIRRQEQLPMFVPPLSAQRAFVSTLWRARAILLQQRDCLRSLDELNASLQHRAFRGEL